MEWKKYPENKPKDFSLCIVINNKYGNCFLTAIYHASEDLFVLQDINDRRTICASITHYLEIADTPKECP